MTTEPPLGSGGACHGSGILGDLIHSVEQATSRSKRFPDGDHEAAWAGHIVVYVGNGQIVQAEWPKVTLDPVGVHKDTIWAAGQPLTDAQRQTAAAAARALVGHPYDVLAYAHFLALLAGISEPAGLSTLAAMEEQAGPICSGVYVREMQAAKADLTGLATASTQNPDWTAPSDCLRWWIDSGWVTQPIPTW